METITLDSYADVREVYRQHDLKQALYDAGGSVMADSLLVLHGAEHRLRRRVENRLFRRGTFRYWEKAFLHARGSCTRPVTRTWCATISRPTR